MVKLQTTASYWIGFALSGSVNGTHLVATHKALLITALFFE